MDGPPNVWDEIFSDLQLRRVAAGVAGKDVNRGHMVFEDSKGLIFHSDWACDVLQTAQQNGGLKQRYQLEAFALASHNLKTPDVAPESDPWADAGAEAAALLKVAREDRGDKYHERVRALSHSALPLLPKMIGDLEQTTQATIRGLDMEALQAACAAPGARCHPRTPTLLKLALEADHAAQQKPFEKPVEPSTVPDHRGKYLESIRRTAPPAKVRPATLTAVPQPPRALSAEKEAEVRRNWLAARRGAHLG